MAALGRPAYITLDRTADLGSDRSVAAMEERCHRMLDAAYAAGVRYFDAARSYGRAEAFLASWLTRRNPPPETITIGSKWGYSYVGDWRLDADVHEVKNLSADHLRRQFSESRALLGTRLQLYQIHSATLESGVLEDRAVLDELGRLRAAGLAIGLTVSGPRQQDVIRRALQVSIDGRNPFQVVQATWNLLEQSAGAALSDASALGWGVIIKESLANGRLTARNRDPHLTALDEPGGGSSHSAGNVCAGCRAFAALGRCRPHGRRHSGPVAKQPRGADVAGRHELILGWWRKRRRITGRSEAGCPGRKDTRPASLAACEARQPICSRSLASDRDRHARLRRAARRRRPAP